MQIIEELMTECLNTVAAHYAKKAKVANINATEKKVQQVIAANWEKIQNEVMALYIKSYKELKKAA